jgi:hypothetical protein
LIAGICALFAASCYSWKTARPRDLLSDLLDLELPDSSAVASRLKHSYDLARFGTDRTELAQSIFSADPALVSVHNAEELLAALHRSVERDFAESRLARCAGWVLSETEARLLAFIAAG